MAAFDELIMESFCKSLYFDAANFTMTKTKCIIVDDSPTDAELLKHFISKEPSLDLVHTFSNGIEAIGLIKDLRPPILFLDIDMPVVSGIDLFKSIGYSPVCIFVTAHSEFALESYEAQAFDFILKPVTAVRFEQCIRRIKDYLELKERADLYSATFEHEHIVIKEGTVNYKVPLNDILYIEALKDYSKVVTEKKRYITLSKLKYFVDRLPKEDFIRIHRSYAVSKSKIKSYTKDELTTGSETFPIGKTYRQDVRQQLENDDA